VLGGGGGFPKEIGNFIHKGELVGFPKELGNILGDERAVLQTRIQPSKISNY
jgi:hypothetical protein